MAKKTARRARSTSRTPARSAPRGDYDLVIVESPAKAKTIEKYLGPGFVVKASVGHIRDLPSRALMVRGEPRHQPRRIIDFLKREAKADLERASQGYARAMDVRYSQLTVRDTTSRWGSCSSNGTLSFSWRLIMAPPRVLDYVAAHEIAHLMEMNHSPDFWAHVYRHCPHTDWSRKWLRKHGHTLHKLPF